MTPRGPQPEALWKDEEAAQALAISVPALRRLVAAGHLEAVLIPGRSRRPMLRFRPSAIKAFQDAHAKVQRPVPADQPPARTAERERLVSMGWDGEEHGRKKAPNGRRAGG